MIEEATLPHEYNLPSPLVFFRDALLELRRAQAKFPGEEGTLTDAEWLAVLVEEIGECARAMQDETDERLREELVQVAAMAARWALSIPRGRGRVPWAIGPAVTPLPTGGGTTGTSEEA